VAVSDCCLADRSRRGQRKSARSRPSVRRLSDRVSLEHCSFSVCLLALFQIQTGPVTTDQPVERCDTLFFLCVQFSGILFAVQKNVCT